MTSAKISPLPPQQMHKVVWVFVAVFVAMAITYPISMLRVSQEAKFKGFHVKSLPLERNQAK
jgi:hypothetical protein